MNQLDARRRGAGRAVRWPVWGRIQIPTPVASVSWSCGDCLWHDCKACLKPQSHEQVAAKGECSNTSGSAPTDSLSCCVVLRYPFRVAARGTERTPTSLEVYTNPFRLVPIDVCNKQRAAGASPHTLTLPQRSPTAHPNIPFCPEVCK